MKCGVRSAECGVLVLALLGVGAVGAPPALTLTWTNESNVPGTVFVVAESTNLYMYNAPWLTGQIFSGGTVKNYAPAALDKTNIANWQYIFTTNTSITVPMTGPFIFLAVGSTVDSNDVSWATNPVTLTR